MSNIRNHPLVKGLLLAWMGFFLGLMIFAVKDPFHWGDEDVANFGLCVFFLFLLVRKRNIDLIFLGAFL